tara:strand:- start:4598 stop:5782 length:1185 start_codon:yes stop_codon:yes gene_type:complete
MSNTITTKKESSDWLFLSPHIFKQEKANIFQNKTTFKVRVLSELVQYSGPSTQEDDSNNIEINGVGTKYLFKGRILDRNMAHEKYLEDPCDPSIAGSEGAQVLASLHTNIIVSSNQGIPNISVGDIVFGELDAGQNGSIYDLQFAEMSNISDVFFFPSSEEKIERCFDIKDAFQDWDGGTLQSNAELPPYDPESGELYIDTVTYAPTLGDLQIALLKELQSRISNSQIPQGIVITSGFRSEEAQARTSYDKLIGEGRNALVNLYAQDDLAQEVEDAFFNSEPNDQLQAIIDVYKAQVARGRFISAHMFSGAIDIGVGGTGAEAVGGILNANERQLIIDTANSIVGVAKAFFYEPSKGSGNHIHGDIPVNFLNSEASSKAPVEHESPAQHTEEQQ